MTEQQPFQLHCTFCGRGFDLNVLLGEHIALEHPTNDALISRADIERLLGAERHHKALHQEWSQVHHDTVDRITEAIAALPTVPATTTPYRTGTVIQGDGSVATFAPDVPATTPSVTKHDYRGCKVCGHSVGTDANGLCLSDECLGAACACVFPEPATTTPCEVYGTKGNEGCRTHRYVPCPTLDPVRPATTTSAVCVKCGHQKPSDYDDPLRRRVLCDVYYEDSARSCGCACEFPVSQSDALPVEKK